MVDVVLNILVEEIIVWQWVRPAFWTAYLICQDFSAFYLVPRSGRDTELGRF